MQLGTQLEKNTSHTTSLLHTSLQRFKFTNIWEHTASSTCHHFSCVKSGGVSNAVWQLYEYCKLLRLLHLHQPAATDSASVAQSLRVLSVVQIRRLQMKRWVTQVPERWRWWPMTMMWRWRQWHQTCPQDYVEFLGPPCAACDWFLLSAAELEG